MDGDRRRITSQRLLPLPRCSIMLCCKDADLVMTVTSPEPWKDLGGRGTVTEMPASTSIRHHTTHYMNHQWQKTAQGARSTVLVPLQKASGTARRSTFSHRPSPNSLDRMVAYLNGFSRYPRLVLPDLQTSRQPSPTIQGYVLEDEDTSAVHDLQM